MDEGPGAPEELTMVCCIPIEGRPKDKNGNPIWFQVVRSRAGDVLLKACNPPQLFVRKATELVLKLATFGKLEDHEKVALRLLGALVMIGSQKTQHQVMGFKTLDKILGDEMLLDRPGVRESALKSLGLD